MTSTLLFAEVLNKKLNIDPNVSSTLPLISLTVFIIVYSACENFLLKRYLSYFYAPYVSVLWLICGNLAENNPKLFQNLSFNNIFTIGILILCIFCFKFKIILLKFRKNTVKSHVVNSK